MDSSRLLRSSQMNQLEKEREVEQFGKESLVEATEEQDRQLSAAKEQADWQRISDAQFEASKVSVEDSWSVSGFLLLISTC